MFCSRLHLCDAARVASTYHAVPVRLKPEESALRADYRDAAHKCDATEQLNAPLVAT